MKVIVLIENTSKCSLCAEHGLSVYIEYNGMKYLLDTGASDTFSANAHQLGINLADIDIAFLSHAHYDHAGGFETFFKENEKAPVYLRILLLKTVIIVQTILIDISEFLRIYWRLIKSVFNI